ncbi:hypothetical protein Poli38472_009468 [Pythium oligandrum]|uniref:Palmitoyltransferase n=1 Tax=Pythium oligandrum TaxID=41045 RepID=A0A8K1CEZ1_PYTOL|nr:hypothetical protein Poli38472_009468 [Pythium oligandrum]|eukprot:TMW61975.1 hypothetical protein Poli38472_009468 [Pythium oligandrum]
MASCLAGAAMTLMALKSGTWLWLVRFFASPAVNVSYVIATLLMLWSYALAVFTDAGLPSFALDHRVRAMEDGPDDDAKEEDENGRYCERCDTQKPPHVHHCSVCRRCVYRMDHHCPWTSNCVGWTNKKFFLLFLVYTSISCLLFNSIVSPLVWQPRHALSPAASQIAEQHETFLQVVWTLSFTVGVVLAGYFVFHLWLLWSGRTTLQFITNKTGEFENYPFLFHWRVYFGNNVVMWWLPVAPELDSRLRGRTETQRLIRS